MGADHFALLHFMMPPVIYVGDRGNEKNSEENQTLRAGYSKSEPKIFALPQTPFRGCRTAKI